MNHLRGQHDVSADGVVDAHENAAASTHRARNLVQPCLLETCDKNTAAATTKERAKCKKWDGLMNNGFAL